jgi:hypothetical protein
MDDIRISLFASSNRCHLWPEFFDSLKGNTIRYQVVFAGNATITEVKNYFPRLEANGQFEYIHTGAIKPAQCYEVARRACKGELVNWTADDCEYSPKALDKIYAFFQSLNDPKAVVSVRTNENDTNNDPAHQWLHGPRTPIMAPLGVMRRDFLDELGGFDRRFVCGQYENQCAMMAMNSSGKKVVLYYDVCIKIDHLRKHGPSTPFWTGYNKDREVLEGTWLKNGVILPGPPFRRFDNGHEPYEDKDILTESQSNKGIWK